jgi:6-phosphofructokinase 1
MQTPTLGEPSFVPKRSHTIGDDSRIPERIEVGVEPGLNFEVVGPRLGSSSTRLRHAQESSRAADCVQVSTMSSGRSSRNRITARVWAKSWDFAVVTGGLNPACGVEPVKITPEFVAGIHQKGGTILGSSLGPVHIGRAVENLIARAMAGETSFVVGFLHERFIHVPVELLAMRTKRLDPASGWWRSVLAAAGQPERFT